MIALRHPRGAFYNPGGRSDLHRRIGRELLLPQPRWTAYRKLHVVEGIAAGYVTEAEIMAAHRLSAEELAAWRRRAKAGPYGLTREAFLRHPVAREDRQRSLSIGPRYGRPGRAQPEMEGRA